jgi:DNA-directed RNA polymerase subunit L
MDTELPALPGTIDVICIDTVPNDPLMGNFALKGKSIDRSVSNAIRRTILTYVPQYGIYRSGIRIEINTNTGLTNSELICQLEQLPIFDIDVPDIVVNPAEVLSQGQLNQVFGIPLNVEPKDIITFRNEPTDDSFIPTKKSVKMFLRKKNISNDPIHITTHDIKLLIDDKEVENYKKYPPILIFRLRSGGEISFQADAYIGFQRMRTCWQAACRCVSIIEDEDLHVKFVSLGQINKRQIYVKACGILSKKLSNLKKFLMENGSHIGITEEDEEIKASFALFNEDDTLGNLISTTLKRHPEVLRAGYYRPHLQKRETVIEYDLDAGKNVIDVITFVLDYLANLMSMLSNIKSV